MWRITFPFLWRALKRRRAAVAAVVVGGLIAGGIATLKSLIESSIIQLVANAMANRTDDVWSEPLGAIGGSDDLVSRFVGLALPGLSLRGGIAVYAVIAIGTALIAIMTTGAREALSREMFTGLYEHGVDSAFARVAPSGLQEEEPGGLAGAIQQGAHSVAGAYAFLVETVQYLVGLVAIVVVLTKVSFGFAAACGLLALAFALISWVQGRRLDKRRRDYDDRRKKLFAFTDDVLANRDILLAHERKDRYLGHLRNSTFEFASINRDLSMRERFYSGSVNVLQDFGRIGILAIVLIAVAQGDQVGQVGDAYFYISIFARLMAPTLRLLAGYDDVRRSISSSETLVTLLAARNGTVPVDAEADSGPLVQDEAAARFTDVAFGYASESLVLNGCTFAVPRVASR